MKKWLAPLILFAMSALPLLAAVGCELNDPDRDVKRLFPAFDRLQDPICLHSKKGRRRRCCNEVEQRLGDSFKGLFETADVPYTLYTHLQGTGDHRLHPRRQPEGPLRRHPDRPGPGSRWPHPGLLLPEADQQRCQAAARPGLRPAVHRLDPGRFRRLRRRDRPQPAGQARSPRSATRRRGPRTISGRRCARSRRT